MLMITGIEIRNFRSIGRMKLNCEDITTFIGENDAGKSNILRALNLFFNNETDYGHPFDFKHDWNRNAKEVRGKPNEIRIALTLRLPSGYIRPNLPKFVRWEKSWREFGLKNSKQQYENKKRFTARSRIPSLLSGIRFLYVPAVKDRNFFARLQGDLYEVLAEVEDNDLRESARYFESNIKTQLQQLHNAGIDIMGSESSLKLPENLRSIFETLQFFGEDGVPLQQRGDGIQMRHIPEILKFMGEKHNSTCSQGTASYTYIWGFEEPENSVEMNACFKMRETLEDIVCKSDATVQIFLTTHSPIFYRIGCEENDKVVSTSYFINGSADGSPHSEAIPVVDVQNLDRNMGLIDLIAPHIEEERKNRLQAEKALQEAIHKPTLLVEGPSDKQVIEKALSLFFPKEGKRIHLIDCNGKSNVQRIARAWPQIRPNLRVAALTDRDHIESRHSREQGNSKAKVIYLEWGPNIYTDSLNRKGILTPIDLESYYSDAIWMHADNQQGWLEPSNYHFRARDLQLIRNSCLSHEEEIRISKKFTTRGKTEMAKYIVELGDKEAKEALAEMKPTLEKIKNHLMMHPGFGKGSK